MSLFFRSIFLALFFLLATCVRAQSWKPAAEAQIQELRTSPITVRVVDANGQPIEDADVSVKMRESAFRWGSIVQMTSVLEFMRKGFDIGDNHPYWNHLRNFNSLGAGNAGKWKQWLRDDERAIYLDIMDWQRENDIGIRTHAPIWPSIRRWNAVPDFVVNAEATATETREEVVRRYIREFLTEYMQTVSERGAYEVDLVNELINEPDLNVDLLGQTDIDDRIDEHVQWYQWAHEAAPDVDLIVNEYNLYQSGNNFHEQFVDYVQKMIDRGAPIDGVGMQGHFFGPIPPYEELKKRLDEVAVLGLPMAVTEFDMVNNTYEEMERVLYSVYTEPLANNFTVWGAWDGNQWRGNAAIFNRDWSLKPSGRAWFDIVKDRWFTDTTVVSGQAATVRGHHGSYDLYVEHDGRVYQQTFDLGTDAREFTITVDGDGYAVPEGRLEVAGAPPVVYPNQPFTLSVTADAEIAEVTYFDVDQIVGFSDAAPHQVTLLRDNAGETFTPVAEVTYASGFRQRLTAEAFTIDEGNTAPTIVDVFPASGTTLLARDSLRIVVEASDQDGDNVRFRLILPDGDTLTGGSRNRHAFVVPELELGTKRMTLIADDGKFAIDDRTLVYNIVSGEGSSVAAVSFPQGENDDIEQDNDNTIDLRGDLDLGEKIAGIRFESAGVPAGATVDSAFIQFVSQKPDQTGQMRVPIYGEKAVNPTPFGGGNGNITNRTATQATVSWDDVPDWNILDEANDKQKTPDLSPIITEIIGQDGWNANKSIHLMVGLNELGAGKRSAYAIDQNADLRAALTVHYRADFDTDAPLPPTDLNYVNIGNLVGRANWSDDNPGDMVLGYELELDGELIDDVAEGRRFTFTDLAPGSYTLRVRTVATLGRLSAFSEPLTFEVTFGGSDVCGEDGSVTAIEEGLMVQDLGKTYSPRPVTVPDYLQFVNADLGGTTSVRRNDSTTLKWKTQGYYQRNRELGQIFNIPEGDTLTLDAVVLRTGNSSKAVLPNTPGAPVYIQFYEVLGSPIINDNGTPQGTESTHGFNTNHRTDDYLDGITYVPIAVARGGVFPDIQPTTQNGGQPGHLRYLRWDLQGDAEITLVGGSRYAFTVGFTEPGPEFGFSLGNNNQAASGAPPALRQDANGTSWWSIRREGDGTLPPTQVPGDNPPADDSLRLALIGESLYEENHECRLMPTTDGYPDVDTYRTLEFYIETTNSCPPAGETCDDGIAATENDLTDGNCGCRGIRPDGGCRPDGFLTYSRYDNLPGRELSALTGAAVYPDAPSFTDSLETFEAPTDVADDYGARIHGYLCPPQTGVYTFWIAGDDNVELRLSSDADPTGANRIAFHDEWTMPRQWDKYPTQQSAELFLEAGRPYYIEALMKEAAGGDNLAVGWQLPDGELQRPIGGGSISTVAGDALTSLGNPPARFQPLAIFPNPSTDRFEVLFDRPNAGMEQGNLTLLSGDGRRVIDRTITLTGGVNRFYVDTRHGVPPGMYIVRIQGQSASYQGRVVIH